MRKALLVAAQVLFFTAVSFGMNALTGWLHVPVPGSIAGMLLIFALLQTRVLRLEWVDLGSKWLLAEMLLFFIPSAVGMIPYKSLLLTNGLRIFIVIFASMIIVMAGAGLLAQLLAKRKERKRETCSH